MPHASGQVDIDVSINGNAIRTYLQDSYDSLRSIMNHDTYYMAYEEGGPMQIALKFPRTFDWLNANALKVVIDIDHLHLEEHTVLRNDLEHAEDGVEILCLCDPEDFDDKHKSKSLIELQHSLPPFRYKRYWYGKQSGKRLPLNYPGYIDRIEDTRHPDDWNGIKGSTLFIHLFRAYSNNVDNEHAIPVSPSTAHGDLHKPFGIILQSRTDAGIEAAQERADGLRKNQADKSRSPREQAPPENNDENSVWNKFWEACRRRRICLAHEDNRPGFINHVVNSWNGEKTPEHKLPDTEHDHEHMFKNFKPPNPTPPQTSNFDSDDDNNATRSPPPSPTRPATPSRLDQTRFRPFGSTSKAFAGRLALRPKNGSPEIAEQAPAIKRKPNSPDKHAGKAFAHRPKTAEHETRRPEKKRKQSSAKISDDDDE